MARAATDAEKAYFRTEGQKTGRFLILDSPDTVYTARATGAVDEDDWSIGFDGGAGTLASCLEDMTLLIGSGDYGEFDVGVARLRKAPVAGTFYIGADPSLVIEDDDYLTVINDFEVFAKHPVGELIDVDVTLGTKFTSPVPTISMECRVRVISEGGTAKFKASDSWVPGGGAITYAWTFTGSASTTGTATATATATYNTSGRYRVKLIATSGGVSATAYGWVYVLGDNVTVEEATIGEPEGEDDGGWSCEVTLYDRPTTVRGGMRAVIYAEDRYGETDLCIGPFNGAENIILAGWVLGETITRNPGQDTVEFIIGGATEMLRRVMGMEAGLMDPSLASDDAADLPDWSKMSSMTVYKGLHYLAHYRSTIARVCDFVSEDWGAKASVLNCGADNLDQQLREYAGRAAMGVYSDRYGRIYAQRDAQLYTLLDRDTDIPLVMALEERDWSEELTVHWRHAAGTATATVEGKIFKEGIETKVGGRSPGNQPAHYGESFSLDEVYMSTKAESRELAGLAAGWLNEELEAIVAQLSANNRLIDTAPRQYVDVTVEGTTYRCVPRHVRLRQGKGNFLFPEVTLEPRDEQWPAVDMDYPGEGEPPIEPPVEPPEEPPEPPYPPPPPEEPGEAEAVVATTSDVRTTEDLDEASPTWTTEI